MPPSLSALGEGSHGSILNGNYAPNRLSSAWKPTLQAFTIPTLVIHGTSDKTVPIDPAGRAAANGISGSKLIEYDGEPHGLFATAPERLNRDLIEFLG
ncbi:alpha/beta fold hydrolase [Rhizobium panacihumi]|uniref:alpha/beta fold hydrolase n=1 Tax=Rhizobium panacihumi TaxID=2008450 RepID=UPI003D7A2FB6